MPTNGRSRLLPAYAILLVMLVGSPNRQQSPSRPVPVQPTPRVSNPALPAYVVALGPRNVTQYPKLVPLQGLSVPEVRRQTKAVWGIPPSYFDLASGRLMGLATVQGKAVPYWPFTLQDMIDKRRVLVLIRQRPKRGERHLWYVDPHLVQQTFGDARVSRWYVRHKLGIDIDNKYDCVTMHLNDCVVADTCRPRSGIIVGRTWIKAFSWDRVAATRETICHFAGPNTTILFGDGGHTISEPKARDPKVGLMFYRFNQGGK